MLVIPTDLNAWHPGDIGAWAAGLDDDPTVTEADLQRADRAVSAALLGEDVAVEIHGPVPS